MEKTSLLFLIASAIGISLAIYTAYEYVTISFSTCNLNQQFSCGSVYQSGYTSLFGIPFYITGLVWFPLLFLLGLLTSHLARVHVNSEILFPLLMIGNIFTGYLWYLELVIIHAICPLCLSLYIVNYFLTGIIVYEMFQT